MFEIFEATGILAGLFDSFQVTLLLLHSNKNARGGGVGMKEGCLNSTRVFICPPNLGFVLDSGQWTSVIHSNAEIHVNIYLLN